MLKPRKAGSMRSADPVPRHSNRQSRFCGSDATFNVGCAITAAQILPPSVYIAMNGRIFSPEETRKNAPKCYFETV